MKYRLSKTNSSRKTEEGTRAPEKKTTNYPSIENNTFILWLSSRGFVRAIKSLGDAMISFRCLDSGQYPGAPVYILRNSIIITWHQRYYIIGAIIASHV